MIQQKLERVSPPLTDADYAGADQQRLSARKDAEARGVEMTPPADVALCVRAWFELGTCRGIGFDAGPIPWTAMLEWAQWHDLDRDATTVLMSALGYADGKRQEKAEAKRSIEAATGKKR